MSKKKQPWSEEVPCVTFREPKPDEFGYHHCKKTILYLETSFERKPITWFLGMDEYSSQTMWKPNVLGGGFDTFQSYHTRISGPNSYSDGSFPMDDLSTEVNKLEWDNYSSLTSDKYSVYGSSWMDTDIFKVKDVYNPSHALITSKLKPEDFIAEIRSSLLLETITSFQHFITTMSHMRHNSTTFSSEKKICAEFMKNSRFRSINLLEEAKDKYWRENCGDFGIKVADICTLEDDEVLQLYSSNVGLSIERPSFLDERYIRDIAVNDLSKGISSTSKAYIGKVIEGKTESEKGNVIRELAIAFYTNGKDKAIIKLSFNHDFSIFDIYAVNSVTYKSNPAKHQYNYAKSGTINGNAENSLSIIDKLVETSSEQVKSEYKEIPGYIPGISTDSIDEFFERLIDAISADHESVSINIHPFPKGDNNTNSWESLLKKTITITNDKTAVVNIAALPLNNYFSYTHNELDDLEDRVNEIFIDYPSLAFRRKTSGSLEERKDGIASKLSKLYSILEPFLVYTIKYSLGSPTIDRPFILVKSDNNTSHHYRSNTYSYLLSAWHLEHTQRAITPDSNTKRYTFSPLYFLKIVRLYKELGSFEEMTSQLNSAIDHERNARPYMSDWPTKNVGEVRTDSHAEYSTGENLSMLKDFNWELGNLAFDRVLQNNNLSYIATSLEDNKYLTEDSVSLSLSHLVKNSDALSGIFQLLIATAFELSIENDTFINFSLREKLLTPKDIILHLLSSDTGSSNEASERIALKSIYA